MDTHANLARQCPLRISCRRETVEHGLECFVRLVRALLGPTAIADSKVESGIELVILGIMVCLPV